MNETATAEDGIIIHLHFASQLNGIAHDNMVVENAVVRYMAISHDQAVVAYHGLTLGGRTAVYGSAFADDRTITDDGQGLFTLELQILRNSAHHR